jgi:hypothetical protein
VIDWRGAYEANAKAFRACPEGFASPQSPHRCSSEYRPRLSAERHSDVSVAPLGGGPPPSPVPTGALAGHKPEEARSVWPDGNRHNSPTKPISALAVSNPITGTVCSRTAASISRATPSACSPPLRSGGPVPELHPPSFATGHRASHAFVRRPSLRSGPGALEWRPRAPSRPGSEESPNRVQPRGAFRHPTDASPNDFWQPGRAQERGPVATKSAAAPRRTFPSP